MKLKAKINYFIEVDVAIPNDFKTVCVNVLNIAAIERAGKNTLLHLTIPNGNDGTSSMKFQKVMTWLFLKLKMLLCLQRCKIARKNPVFDSF